MTILVLDGGMGATLEELGHDCSGPMWGSELITRDPSAIAAAHKGFVEAGADIISTATYQLSTESLTRAGYAPESHPALLGTAVQLAATEARGKSAVALSLGAYGATLPGGEEYRGFYPPPFGPRAYTEGGDNTNYSSGAELEGHVAALAQWHLDRLRLYAADRTWDSIEDLAFETVPTISEYRGIRRAVAALYAELPVSARRPRFWIASAFPNRQHPQQNGDGGRVSVAELVAAALEGDGARPDALGINCTAPAELETLVPEYTAAVAQHAGPAPWLVIYPDGGDILDFENRKWIRQPGQSPPEWAARLLRIARAAEQAGDGKTWGGVVVGGCCGAMFSKIEALRKALREEA
ncbi:hypothetical protein Q8F55_002941 [Vanrija albida]|uniref:Hcy-binding domain-containing protein n=1 Tax=Vanrija albida TaxID=181172 RepID=A0ABR3QC60_9TREE